MTIQIEAQYLHTGRNEIVSVVSDTIYPSTYIVMTNDGEFLWVDESHLMPVEDNRPDWDADTILRREG